MALDVQESPTPVVGPGVTPNSLARVSMLKMYNSNGHHAGESAFWEDTWSRGNFEAAVRFCDVDPLRPLFDRFVGQGALLLEGGCGLGHYVAYYSARGIRVVGLDFAHETLSLLGDRNPRLNLCSGDVAALPFQEGQFDAYYSGGVVEHFEHGPAEALREARRVLRPGGVFLVSVPYLSPLRRLTSLLRSGDRNFVSEPRVDTAIAERRRFFQYAFSDSEFEEYLGETGFKIISKQGYAILFGLYELPLLQRAVNFALRVRGRKAVSDRSAGRSATLAEHPTHPQPVGLLKRFLVSEDASMPIAGPLVRFLRWSCANMRMYICLRE